MAGERGSAAGTALVIMLSMSMFFHCQVAEAASYPVGGTTGWTTPATPAFYSTWTNGKTFYGGDTLVFKYAATHNLVNLGSNKANYDSCTASTGATTYTTSPKTITLKQGANYFICSIPGHCKSGMKLAVTAK